MVVQGPKTKSISFLTYNFTSRAAVVRLWKRRKCEIHPFFYPTPIISLLLPNCDKGIIKLPIRPSNAQLVTSKRTLSIQATYSDEGRSSSGSAFIGGFVLGGLFVGTLGCILAPQISKVLAGTDKKELLKKLPNFIYDEEKALEKTRQKLAQKIAELNSAIDDVSSQLKSDDDEPVANGVVPDETEALA